MATKKIKIDYFLVNFPGPGIFEDIIKKVGESALGKNRNVTIAGTPIRLQTGGDVKDKICEGDFIRLQMDDLPTDAGLDGTAKRIEIADDHGLGHETAFLYHAPWKLLLLQRSKNGVSPSAMAKYIENKGKIESPIELVHVARKDAAAKLSGMKKNRKIRVKVAAANKAPTYTTSNIAVSSAVTLLGSMPAKGPSLSVLDFTLSLDGSRFDTITHSHFVGTVKEFLKIPVTEAKIEKLDVTGSETDEGKLQVMDYLDFVVGDEQPVKTEERALTYHQRSLALRKSFNDNIAQLTGILGKPEE